MYKSSCISIQSSGFVFLHLRIDLQRLTKYYSIASHPTYDLKRVDSCQYSDSPDKCTAPRTKMVEGPEDIEIKSISAYGIARSTISEKLLCVEEIRKLNVYFQASLYLCLGMLYLKENPLLKEPLSKEHLKPRLLGHWGSDTGQIFTWMHFNRMIKKYDLDVLFVSGPGHGALAILSQCYLEGVYSEVYPDKTQDEEGIRRFFK
jgi:xylulose-5-phosphate/fructose-6-phosphate phosphoketolase